MTTDQHVDQYAEERADLLEALTKHRTLFRGTVAGLSDDQSRLTPTVSTLSLGGLVKHVAITERAWADFVTDGPADEPDVDWDNVDWSDPPEAVVEHTQGFVMGPDETLEQLLATYDEVAAATDELVRTVDLAERQSLPAAPWFEPGATWAHRRTFWHVVAETAQHAGHADIIRETIDGQKSMG
ncbi:DinB family protein [Nocardioides sp. C4-1]|uniref:DinB family protein n=1 Tax=Nocardioides sp. C4-1 TaxID=3151851 RepID=UPI003267CAB7